VQVMFIPVGFFDNEFLVGEFLFPDFDHLFGGFAPGVCAVEESGAFHHDDVGHFVLLMFSNVLLLVSCCQTATTTTTPFKGVLSLVVVVA
jgi:hypothetical protein